MKYCTAIIALLGVLNSAFGQIHVQDLNEGDRVDTTKYVFPNNELADQDSIYIYYTPRGEWTEYGQLMADLGDYTKLNFKWYEFVYDTENLGFTKLILSEDSVSNSILKNVYTGGYRVNISNQNLGLDTNFYCWVFLNRFQIGDINVESSTCETMELKTRIQFDEVFRYRDRYDPTIELQYTNKINSIQWTDDPASGNTIPGNANPSFAAPTVETKYTINVTDKYGVSRTNSRTIWAGDDDGRGNLYLKAVKADFIGLRADKEYKDSITGPAPLSAMFQSKSENAVELDWCFYKHPDWMMNASDTILYSFNTLEISDSLTFTNPPKSDLSQKGHNIALKAKGPIYKINDVEFQCESRILKENFMNVEITFLPKFANVFSPESATNNLFHFENYTNTGGYKPPVSVKSFSIYIYNRWGGRVYFYEGPIDKWEGWNGESYIGAGMVATGVYYYVATVIGYDEKPIEDKQVTGFIHVFRGN